MMKAAALALTALLGVSGSALAQYTGPSDGKKVIPGSAKKVPRNVAPTTVRALTASGKDDTEVSLQGRIVRHIGGDHYRFTDGTGEIDLDIDTEQWPANTPIDDKAELRITGEYNKGLIRDPKVEVARIDKLQ
ncbi:YgiW/YdeI family stress tolerance OB fold protein [Massilia psychrophila]|jgi:uncharacterized protein (TIGR00156 family)|nr:NirD/YgiW/YdeI family stress tolerance protein [Massilia psychrophila]GGE75803.1 hypothetical protein GCM10008020_20550 [Massilia psychrophila]